MQISPAASSPTAASPHSLLAVISSLLGAIAARAGELFRPAKDAGIVEGRQLCRRHLIPHDGDHEACPDFWGYCFATCHRAMLLTQASRCAGCGELADLETLSTSEAGVWIRTRERAERSLRKLQQQLDTPQAGAPLVARDARMHSLANHPPAELRTSRDALGSPRAQRHGETEARSNRATWREETAVVLASPGRAPGVTSPREVHS